MTWGRLDDGFHSHARIVACPFETLGLFAVAISWAANHETDGWLASDVVTHLSRGRTDLVDDAVRRGMWERQENGYQIHDYLQYNPSKAFLAKQRKRQAKNSKGYRTRHHLGVTDESSVAHRPPSMGRVGKGSTVLLSSPNGGVPGEPSKRRRRLRLPETPFPPDMTLTPAMLDFAMPNLTEAEAREEFVLFKNHHVSFGNLRADWPASWRTWCIKHVKWNRERHNAGR